MTNRKSGRLDIYQSHFGKGQLERVSPLAIPYDVSHNTAKDSREYELFKEIFKSRGSNPKPWGLVSWKFQHKAIVPLDEFYQFADEKLADGYQCVFINPMIGNEAVFKNVWEQGALVHKGFIAINTFIAERYPKAVNSVSGLDSFAFCNYFVATPKFWSYYFKFVDAMVFALNKEARAGTGAGQVWSGSAHYSRDLEVTMRPFVIERLFSALILSGSDIKACAYPYSGKHYIQKFGQQLGAILADLSFLKNKAITKRSIEELAEWQRLRNKLYESPARGPILNLDDPPNIFLDPDYSVQRK
jgi:hypothetical protein